jgi:hypothetical protein
MRSNLDESFFTNTDPTEPFESSEELVTSDEDDFFESMTELTSSFNSTEDDLEEELDFPDLTDDLTSDLPEVGFFGLALFFSSAEAFDLLDLEFLEDSESFGDSEPEESTNLKLFLLTSRAERLSKILDLLIITNLQKNTYTTKLQRHRKIKPNYSPLQK